MVYVNMMLLDANPLPEEEDDHKVTCPSCRHRFTPLAKYKVIKGDWTLFVNRTYYQNVDLKLTAGQCKILFLIAKSSVPLSAESLGYRVCSEATIDVANSICVQLARIRRRFRDNQIPIPFETYLKEGYVWLKP